MKKILREKFVKKNLENICDEQVNHHQVLNSKECFEICNKILRNSITMLYNLTQDASWDLSLIHNHCKISWKNDSTTQACLKVYICLKVRKFLMP